MYLFSIFLAPDKNDRKIVTETTPIADYSNYNLNDIITPINVDRLRQLFIETNYPKKDAEYFFEGFHRRF